MTLVIVALGSATLVADAAAARIDGPAAVAKKHPKQKHAKRKHSSMKGRKHRHKAATKPHPAEVQGTKAITSASEIPSAPAFTDHELAAHPKENWITPEGGVSGDYYSRLSEITPANVTDLKPAWMTQLDGSAETKEDTAEADPTEYKGVLYQATGTDDIFAVSVATGKILWVHPGELKQSIAGDVCCGWDNRGVAIGDGLVYSSELDGAVMALSQKTGQLVWRTEFGQPSEGLTATAAPLYYHGMVFIGPVGSEYGVRGFMAAFNAKTGAMIWKHYNIPAPGEPGHDTWPTGTSCKECNAEWMHGGATTWNAPTVNPKLGLIYYSTANAGQDFFGGDRAGEDLWTVSMLALNYKTGAQAWGYQEVHHDIWDYDASNQPTMIKVSIKGKPVEGIVQSNKDGFAYFVDQKTGKPVFPITEEPVPTNPADASYPTQPIPSMEPFVRLQATPEEVAELQETIDHSAAQKHLAPATVVHGGWHEQDVFSPWALQGEASAPISSAAGSGDREAPDTYDPKTGYYYVCAVQGFKGVFTVLGTEWEWKEGLEQAGATGVSAFGPKPTGTLTAYDMSTGKIAWQDQWAEQCYSGLLSTSGGVLFAGQNNGEFQAYDAASGKLLWSFETGAGVNAPACTFEFAGKQYVAIYAGGNAHGPASVVGDNLWLFRLNATGGPSPIPLGQTPPAPEPLPEGTEPGRGR